MKLKKRFLFLLTMILTLSIGAMPVSARWTYTAGTSASLGFEGTTAYVDVSITGYSTAKSISGKVYLEEQVSANSWKTHTTWNVSSSNSDLAFSGSTSVTSKKTYRVYVVVTVYGKDGGSEDVSFYGPTRTCP